MELSDIKIGNKILLTEFAYLGRYGGTGQSNWQYDEKFSRPAVFTVTKIWDDYECGVRGWCEPDETDTELMDYLKRNAFKGTPKNDIYTVGNINFPSDKYTCFFSEFDIIENKTEDEDNE